VVIENFRPGVMDRLGLGPDAMTVANRGLIYCSMPGFATDDPRAGIAAWEGVVGAATATYRPASPGGPPVYTAIPISSAYAAFQAVDSVAVALIARERDGYGQVIEVPLHDATFTAIGSRGLRYLDRPPVEDRAAFIMRSMSGQFQCEDGRWVMYVPGNLNARAFLTAIGADEWFSAACDGSMSPDEFLERIRGVFRTRPAREWERYCEEVGTECAVCRTSAEWLDDPGGLDTEIVVDLDDPILGRVRGPGINVRLSEAQPSIRAPRPLPDADRDAILAGLAAAKPSIPSAFEPAMRAALDGVKVLDLCIILAGPTCGRTLAEFGADVIKIDSPSST
jgi:crotonobetainyl-CoA:carnitine CoA-transferase CaiB-like acyl-CoA transferase